MKVQGLWMQSIGLILFVADVYIAHDSSMTVEAAGPIERVNIHWRSCCGGGAQPWSRTVRCSLQGEGRQNAF